jgi:hypothetical protein
MDHFLRGGGHSPGRSRVATTGAACRSTSSYGWQSLFGVIEDRNTKTGLSTNVWYDVAVVLRGDRESQLQAVGRVCPSGCGGRRLG